MAEIDFLNTVHNRTKRDYLARVTEHDKADCAVISKQFGFEYWDGERHHGYGGYTYDGRWRSVADEMAARYGLKAGDRILDVGCGKGFLLYEFTEAVPGVEVVGLDISDYAIEHAKEEVKPFLEQGHAKSLPYEDDSFDLVVSFTTLHNLQVYDLFSAVREMERVGRQDKCIIVDSYRDERERINLMYWQLTCEAFYRPREWKWLFDECGYTGDYGFIYFE